MHLRFLSFLISYRWHFQPVPTQTQSRSLQRWLMGWSNPKCCGLWAQCWLWSSSSSLSSPSCTLRSKKLCSVILLCVCVSLNSSGTCVCRFLLVASGMEMRHAPLCHLNTAVHRPNCFPTIIYSVKGKEPKADWFVFQKILIPPKWFWPIWPFSTVPCDVSVEMAADSASLTKSTAWLSKTLC